MPILILSYHDLEFRLRSCFSYCALYRKDSKIFKKELIRLWIAQGYVVPRGNGQSLEDVGEKYFSILLQRCFFHDVQKSKNKIRSFKLHDVALEVSENEFRPVNTKDMNKVVRHVISANPGLTNAHIRTYLRLNGFGCLDDTPLARLLDCNRLRTLDLSFRSIEGLPASIGKLIHLRYLNLCANRMEVLPDTVTNLYNLQTLDLGSCSRLKELPKNFSNLVNLRVLNLYQCDELRYLPSGMSTLINLYELSAFKVGASRLKQHAELEDHVPSGDVLATDNTIRQGAYIREKEHLDTISFYFKHQRWNEGAADYEEELLEALQPHENLKELLLFGYKGVRMPRWHIQDNLTSVLPNLVTFALSGCYELTCLPSLGNLQSLKELQLCTLRKLEYMKTPLDIASVHGEASGECLQFFACLQKLELWELPKFKGWGRSGEIGSIVDSHQYSLVFSRLIALNIQYCDNLTSLPGCPNIESLDFMPKIASLSVQS